MNFCIIYYKINCETNNKCFNEHSQESVMSRCLNKVVIGEAINPFWYYILKIVVKLTFYQHKAVFLSF